MSRFKKLVTTTIRVIVGIGLACGLIHLILKYTGADLWNELLNAEKPLLILAFVLYGAIIGVSICRWNLLLRVQGVHLRPWHVIRLSMIGNFFNLAIPGAVSGDLVKMAFLTQYARDKKLKAILTVPLDRILGLFGLFIVAGVTLLFYLPFLINLDQNTYRLIQIAALMVGLGSIMGVLGILLAGKGRALMGHARVARLVDFGKRKLPDSIILNLKRLVDALQLYSHNRGTIFVAVLLSVLVHTCLAVNLFIIGAAVQENMLHLGDYFLATQISNAVAGIPITPAGIGTRDATLSMFFIALGSTTKKAGIVPIMFTLIILFWGLIGGVIFIASRTSRKGK